MTQKSVDIDNTNTVDRAEEKSYSLGYFFFVEYLALRKQLRFFFDLDPNG